MLIKILEEKLMELIQIVGVIFALFALSRVVLQLKRRSISFNEGLFWIFVWGFVVIFLVFPEFFGYVAEVLGVGRGVDALIYISIVVLFYLIYRLYAKINNLERQITHIVREIAIRDRYEPKKRD
ncbi:conserved hypothetical protein [Methanocaldococcus jannaschii DSM 2661]|uniref:Uncharacterized protein MJ1580 n=2 Tax=Methanocaldococcus jannaschii TaxID=2190 RepID=Y1580_METJA|nr:RecName: Full=Uncharacterized protein MJ1580 [Methanocaldococcus jannaschii DSM 2661]AAB99600.1 conserved hypothetical protein [Methanocaldococcus jannaschii DSM 2661]